MKKMSETQEPVATVKPATKEDLAVYYARWLILIADEKAIAGLNVNIIARHMGLKPSYLSRAFKKKTGENIHGFLKRMKFLWFYDRFERGDLTVKEMAELLDYRSTSHFIKAYRKQFNMTPGEDRRLNRFMREQIEGRAPVKRKRRKRKKRMEKRSERKPVQWYSEF
jgi:AraC-like DNA-binding protein